MAKYHGLSMIVKVDVSASQTAVGLQRSATLNLSMEDVDITTKDDNYWRVRLPSTREHSVDFEAVFDDTNSAQDELFTDFDADPSNSVSFEVDIGTTDTMSGTGYLTELNFEGSHEDAIIMSGSLAGSGAITKS